MHIKIQHNHLAKQFLTIFSIVGGYLVLVLSDKFSIHNQQTFCLFKLITTIPCPGCGMGRATLALLHGDIPLSVSYNILCIPFTIIVINSLYRVITDIFRKKESLFKYLNKNINKKYKVFLMALIFISWVLNIIRL